MANTIDPFNSASANQPPALEGFNGYRQDQALQRALVREGAEWAAPMVDTYGGLCGGNLRRAGFAANEHPPELQTHDPAGRRIDRVLFHPAYHRLMEAALASGWPLLPWREQRPGAHAARAAMEYLHHQADSGSGCPLTMSFAAVPVLRQAPELAAEWLPRLTAGRYDPSDRPYFQKTGVTLGMGLTEKQGGSDLAHTTTRAEPLPEAGPGRVYRLTGHKWFFSAPMSDAFLVLARTEQGPGCFLLPRWWADGRRNPLRIQRLKQKLGNRSNASCEVEFHGALAWPVGEPGAGIPTLMQMVSLTRFDCIVGSAALMRQALVEALHHCRWRWVEGRRLSEQPLMQNVLADLAVESEAALVLGMRLARALDGAAGSEREKWLVRIATAVGKYWVCKRAVQQVGEALECLGGNGYVETSMLPRLLREAPVNAIWEGSSNVQCLDLLRALRRHPQSLEVLLDEIKLSCPLDTRLKGHVERLEGDLMRQEAMEYRARRLVEQLAVALQASLLLRVGDGDLAELFCASRLNGGAGLLFGDLESPQRFAAILDSSCPEEGPDSAATDPFSAGDPVA